MGIFNRAVHDEIETKKNTYLDIYASSQKEADRVLKEFAGPEQAKRWKEDKQFNHKSEPYEGKTRGARIRFSREVKEGDIPLPERPEVLKINKQDDQQIFDKDHPVKRNPGTGNGTIIININLAEFSTPKGKDPQLQDEFKKTLNQALKRADTLETQLAERDASIEKQLADKKNPQEKFAQALKEVVKRNEEVLKRVEKMESQLEKNDQPKQSPSPEVASRSSPEIWVGSLRDAVEAAQKKVPGSVLVASSKNGEPVQVINPDSLYKLDEAAKRINIPSSYTVTEDGIIKNAKTGKDEFYSVAKNGSNSSSLSPEIKTAVDAYFNPKPTEPSIPNSKRPSI